MPSVHTVPSDFADQQVQTETQAKRLEHEAEAAKAKTDRAAHKAAGKAKKTDSWITQQFSKLSDESAGGIAAVNLATIIGVSSYLGYKAWGLYERGRLGWDNVGAGVGILAALGAAQAVVGSYLYRGNNKRKNN